MSKIYGNAEQDTSISFTFDEADKTEIEHKDKPKQKLELVMNSKQDRDCPGWIIDPHTTPLTVRAITQLEIY